MIAKLILDKHASIVIPNSRDTIFFNDQSQKWGVKAKWKSMAEQFLYSKMGYNINICLWIPPNDCLVIEFEGNKIQNKDWIEQTENSCKKYKLDYCVCDHLGKSQYIWIFNIKGLEKHEHKKALAKLLVPYDATLDWTNLGQTLVPVIEHAHWKHNNIHKIIRGVTPLKHQNSLPKECNVAFKTAEKQQQKLFSFSSVMINDDKLKKIIDTDFKIQRLLAGDTSKYASPSEARMALYCCLCAYGLSDEQVHQVMSQSKGLNYFEKQHLWTAEVSRARQYISKKREMWGN